MTNWVGDAVMNTPFLAATRTLFPRARIIVLARSSVAPVVDSHPDVDEVWRIDDRSWAGRWEAARRLRAARIDVAFALPNSMNAALLLWAGRARHRVGYDRDGRGMLLTVPVALRPSDLAVHEVRYYLRLLAPWGVKNTNPPPLKLFVTDDERRAFDAWLEGRGIPLGQPLIGVNPAAYYGTAKRWLPERFAAAAGELAARLEARVLVTGLDRERPIAEEVCRAGGPAFDNVAGEMDLRGLMTFLERARLFLTNDSGAMHLAAGLGTPLVAIFGSTDWVTTAPLGEQSRIVRVETECAPCLLRDCPIDHRCMNRVTVEMVVETAEELVE